FVHNAQVFVSDGSREYALQEYNSDLLPDETLKMLAEQFGLTLRKKSGKLPITLYFYSTPELLGQPGKNYKLRIQTDKEIATASTSIPHLNPLDSLWLKPHPDPKMDTLVALWYRYKDPDTLGN